MTGPLDLKAFLPPTNADPISFLTDLEGAGLVDAANIDLTEHFTLYRHETHGCVRHFLVKNAEEFLPGYPSVLVADDENGLFKEPLMRGLCTWSHDSTDTGARLMVEGEETLFDLKPLVVVTGDEAITYFTDASRQPYCDRFGSGTDAQVLKRLIAESYDTREIKAAVDIDPLAALPVLLETIARMTSDVDQLIEGMMTARLQGKKLMKHSKDWERFHCMFNILSDIIPSESVKPKLEQMLFNDKISMNARVLLLPFINDFQSPPLSLCKAINRFIILMHNTKNRNLGVVLKWHQNIILYNSAEAENDLFQRVVKLHSDGVKLAEPLVYAISGYRDPDKITYGERWRFVLSLLADEKYEYGDFVNIVSDYAAFCGRAGIVDDYSKQDLDLIAKIVNKYPTLTINKALIAERLYVKVEALSP